MNLKQSIGVVTDRAPHPAEAGSILSNHPKIILADCSRCCQDLLKALLRVKEHWLNNVDRTHLVLLDSDIKELLLARDTVLFDSRRDDTKQNMFGTSSFFPKCNKNNDPSELNRCHSSRRPRPMSPKPESEFRRSPKLVFSSLSPRQMISGLGGFSMTTTPHPNLGSQGSRTRLKNADSLNQVPTS